MEALLPKNQSQQLQKEGLGTVLLTSENNVSVLPPSVLEQVVECLRHRLSRIVVLLTDVDG